MSDKDKEIQTLEGDEPIESEPLESGPVEPLETGDPAPLATSDEGTLIKDFPLATAVNDDDDIIIETSVPQTEHCKAETFKNYVIKDALLSMYPVGAIYISTQSTSPASLFGGTWSQIQNRFLIASGSSYTAGSTGGSATATLSSSNLPSHTHSLPSHTHSLPSHTHSLPSHTHSIPSHTHSIPSHTHSIPSLSGTAASAGSHTHDMYFREDNTVGGNGRRYGTSSDHSSGTASSTILSAGAHTHSVTTNSSKTGSYSGTTGSTSATSGSTSGTSGSTSGTSGSTSGTSGSTGSGTSFSIVPPYLAVYMWQRTA